MHGHDRRSTPRRCLARAVCTGALALTLALSAGITPDAQSTAQTQGAASPIAALTPASADGTEDPGPSPAEPSATPDHPGGNPLPVKERAPLPASKDTLTREHGERSTAKPSHPRPSLRDLRGKRRAAECSTSDFTGSTGAELVAHIRTSTPDCIHTLFSLTGSDAAGAFRQEQMVTVANALRDGSAGYPGDGSTGMPQTVLYLRAGYYVHWYNEPDVGEYGPQLESAIQGGLDAFFASEHSRDVTDANGETLAESITLIDSSEQNARYLPVVERMLTGYDSSYDDKWWMLNAVNNVYTVLWRGHQVPAFVSAVEADPGVLDTLRAFAVEHVAMLGGERSYLVSNAGRELARFVQHPGLADTVRPLMKELLDLSQMTGPTAGLWVGVAEMADAYDKANCAEYGVCDLPQRLRDAVLADRQSCSDSITVVAQNMSAGDFSAACDSLNGQDAFFHQVARDPGPVQDDHNTRIEVVVFDSSTDYQTYGGVIFGISTDNGGMYLEGDPSVQGNLPRFIAYEAEWTRPDFQIWNLNHEYTHYLDGRFDMYGDFADGTSTPTVWWIEGFAEYVSYTYRGLRYEEAVAEAGKKTYRLSELFATTYENADTTRVYRWGYLAVRYMLEKHPSDLGTVLGAYRAGDWAGARRHLTETIGTRYDSDWNNWLDACAQGGCARAS
ncbi:collagenase [Streptomyces xanthii]|uniref:microbial collagenase n=1 Tax=Streptomyces xanthii TaxID=2768069 RepID=A0A7H1BHX7_9ACTN|nr:collagenase [Streptomyces xanthii]